MTVVSTKEFNTNQKKYFDLALHDHVIIKRGRNRYRLVVDETKRKYKTPDDDLRRAIPMEEVRDSIIDYIRKKHAK